MKHKINILIPIFTLLILIYVIRSFVGPHIKVETLLRGSMEDVINTKGVMIKYETVLKPQGSGTFETLVQDGTRVSVGQAVTAVYSGNVDSDLRTRLEQINDKIAQIQKNQTDLLRFGGDVSLLEQKISEQTELLVQNSLQGDLDSVSNIQLVLEALCEKKAQVHGSDSGRNILEELQTQKASLESQLGAAHNRMFAPASGIFSTGLDGFEQIITPYNMTELSPTKLNELIEREHQQAKDEETVGCKIIKNFRYFVALNVPVEQMTGLRTGNSVNLRFYDLSSDLVKAFVFYISPEENGSQTVILETDRHLDSLLKRRIVNLEFIKNQYSGYRISVECLRTKDDVTGVYVRRDDVLKFIPVEILYNTDETVIIDSASNELPLRLYDEVVVSASSYEEGKLLR